MKLQDQVCTIEQAKRLKELGITQDSIWFWAYPVKEKMISTRKGIIHNTTREDLLRDNDGDEFDHDVAAAFSIAELCAMLPASIQFAKKWATLRIIKADACDEYNQPDSYLAGYYTSEKELLKDWVMGDGRDKLPEAAAGLLIMLIEHGKTTIDEVNARLCG